ncbi:MAG: nuclear transport factor 2 family protein [Acidobacteriota bacterium]|nr:nuclear transport factor 2 family protein [Acidobacteriota bacterium]
MSETNNTQIVQEGYAKFGSGDIEGLLNLFSDDIDWTTPTVEGAPFTGTRNGREEVGEFFAQLNEAEEFSNFEPQEFIAQGDKVVVLGRSSGTVKATGRTIETEWVHIFTVKDGKITGFKEFFDTAAAERAYQKATTA